MISKEMQKVLKHTPHYPDSITMRDLQIKTKVTPCLLSALLNEALSNEFIRYRSRNPYNSIDSTPISLTEDGQLEIEEYSRTCNSSNKATWALIISGLSFVASVVAILLSLFDVQ